jgi:hypothetical protein
VLIALCFHVYRSRSLPFSLERPVPFLSLPSMVEYVMSQAKSYYKVLVYNSRLYFKDRLFFVLISTRLVRAVMNRITLTRNISGDVLAPRL